MKPDSEPSSNDNVPSFFLNDNKNTDELHNEKNIKTDKFEPLLKTTPRSSKLVIHWPSLGIGAMIAIVCVFSGMLMANMIGSDPTQTQNEILIKDIESTKNFSLSSFTNHASPILGNKNAALTMVEYGDYQCTFCNKFFHETEGLIIQNYVKTGKVKILFKDFIVVGQDSIHAANAAHCANDQNVFWEYHSLLYNNWAGEGTGWISSERLNEFATTLKLDMNEFSECVSKLRWKELIDSSHQDGITIGVSATPTFFVIDQNNNILKITGAQHYDVFKEVFDSALEK